MNDYPSTFLFAVPSSISGAAMLLDFAGTLVEYNQSETPGAADATARRMDGVALRQDGVMALREIVASPSGVLERVG